MSLDDLEARAAVKPPELAELSDRLVFGEGDPDAAIMVVGEAPGEEEDRTGRPFVGRAGQLLDKVFAAVDLHRDDLYVTNIVKFRPPANRNPKPEEIAASVPLLVEQIRLVRPQIIVPLGNVPTQWFLDTKEGITRLRGRWAAWHGVRVLPMYHPAYLLRNPSREAGGPKWLTWQDVRALRTAFDELGPKAGAFVVDTAAPTPLF